jgi:peptide/nickel transport system ATP-binding protein
VVGGSGCGKSTLSSALLRLLPANGEVAAGQVLLSNMQILALPDEQMRRVRVRDVAMIFRIR